jgi:hypothetical protein
MFTKRYFSSDSNQLFLIDINFWRELLDMPQQFPPVRRNRAIEKLEGRQKQQGQREAAPTAGTVSIRWR